MAAPRRQKRRRPVRSAHAEQHKSARVAELEGNLKADAFVGAGDQRNAPRGVAANMAARPYLPGPLCPLKERSTATKIYEQ
jgi:hypothetical protein